MNRPDHIRSRPYDTTEPEGLGKVLSSLFALKGYGRAKSDRQWENLWAKCVEPEHISKTKVLSYRNGILLIGVSHSALLNELSSFHKFEILERLRQSAPQERIKDLKFKLRSDLNGR